MSRLIDADRLIEEYKKIIACSLELGVPIRQFGIRDAIEMTQDAPTADAVEVVRCKDCKHFHLDYMANVNGVPLIVAHEICCFNEENPIKVLQNHFCSWGERKENEI